MTTYFVTRHQGAKDWAEQQGLNIDHIVEHLDPKNIHANDIIIGTLPIHLAAEIQQNGGRYLHLTLNLPPELRGKELTADDMTQAGASLTEYHITAK